jgi:hypothetical protein
MGNGGSVPSLPLPRHYRKHRSAITLPPLAILAS